MTVYSDDGQTYVTDPCDDAQCAGDGGGIFWDGIAWSTDS